MLTVDRKGIELLEKPTGDRVGEELLLGHEAELLWPDHQGDQDRVHPGPVGGHDDVVAIGQVFTIVNPGPTVDQVEQGVNEVY